MTSMSLRVLLLAGATLAVGACNKPATTTTTNTTTAETNTTSAAASSNDPVSSAESAAPASLAHDAAIVTFDASGTMKQLRAGKNGWTCMPDAPDTPGPDPMCFDGNAAKWADAWVHHKTPPDGTPGVMYMLEGGTDASNTDPYATKPTQGSDWLHTGPHMMLVGSQSSLAGYPSGPNPDTKAPYVMWAGTPYAHLMIPVS